MLISIRLLTTFLTPEEIGNYYIILSILAFFNLVLLNPPGMYFSRHLLHWQRSKNLLNALVVFIVWIIFVAILSIPIDIFIYNWLSYDTKFDLDLFLIYIALAITVSTIHRNVMGGSNTLGYRKEFVIYMITTLTLGVICSVSIVYFYYNYALGWLIGIVISEFLMLYIIFHFFIQKNRLDIENIKVTLTKERISKILIFILPVALTTFLFWGQTTAYRFIVDYKYSAEVLGYIAVGLGVSSAVFGAIESISMQYFNPIFLKKILDATKEQRTEAWNEIAKQIVPIYILVAFFTISMSEVLINILVDKKFHDSYIYTMIGVGIEFFRVMTALVYNVSQSEYQTSYTIKPYLLGFVVSLGIISSINFGTNYFMIPVVLSFTYFLVFILMYRNMKKLLDIHIKVKIFRVLFLSLPFYLIYFIDISNTNIISNVFIILIFGIYFLYIIWNEMKLNKRIQK
jgi:O-antigen/teichoic acid export membrane protein